MFWATSPENDTFRADLVEMTHFGQISWKWHILGCFHGNVMFWATSPENDTFWGVFMEMTHFEPSEGEMSHLGVIRADLMKYTLLSDVPKRGQKGLFWAHLGVKMSKYSQIAAV